MAALKKLVITRCTVSNGTPSAGSEKFQVMLNPSGFTHDHSISYTGSSSDSKSDSGSNPAGCKKQALGKSSPVQKFGGYGPETVSFNLRIDGTGVVGQNLPAVKDQVKQLKKIVYKYEGAEHEPSVVQILWGSFIFYGRLESIKIQYTLFKPNGEPLRAEVDLSFTMYMSSKEEASQAQRQSPDLTHIVELKAGDTLPLLCHRIYKDSSYYAEVARINNIVNFRGLKPGSRLEFPPLR